MKLIKPSFEILEQLPGLEGMYKQIELAGRTCYKSEDKITEDSAKEFVDRMIKSGHGAMLEHGTVYLSLDMTSREQYFKYCYNKFSKANSTGSAEYSTWRGFVTTNLRVLVENDWMEDLQYLCEPTEFHEKRHTVKFICDRGVSHEFVRHRVFSFAQESTRYCNYSKDKFGNEITFVFPIWMDEELLKSYGSYHTVARSNTPESIFIAGLNNAEKDYLSLVNMGWKAQEARAILPNALKTELVMTGFESDWKHFFELRCPGSAHPQARELAIPLQEKFKELKWVD
jgi:thymidylate synthase (FAD)